LNATETIFALALASNCHPEHHFKQAFAQIAKIGQVKCSEIYLIPCRDGIGADYWNAACLLKSEMSVEEMTSILKKMEDDSGRVRPSHQISLDVDLIAWGEDLSHMQFNPKKLPLATDVKIPMLDIWQSVEFQHEKHEFPIVHCVD